MSDLSELKTYYQAQAETQPEPALCVAPGPARRKRHPVRAAILIAAAFVLIAGAALAASGAFGQIFWSNDAQTFQTAVAPHPVSAQLRDYMGKNTPESGSDGAHVYRLTFDSLDDFANFFGVTLRSNANVDLANISVTVLYYPAEDCTYVIGSGFYIYDTAPAATQVEWEVYFWCSDTQTQPRDLTRSESGPYAVTTSDVQTYTNKTSGVQAVISWDPQVGGGSDSPDTAKMYHAHFAVDDIFYRLSAYSNDPGITSADLLKTVIDGYQ